MKTSTAGNMAVSVIKFGCFHQLSVVGLKVRPPFSNSALLALSYLSSCNFLVRTDGTGWSLLLPFAGQKPSCPCSTQSLCTFYLVWNDRTITWTCNKHTSATDQRATGRKFTGFCFTHLRFFSSCFLVWRLSLDLLTSSSGFFCTLLRLKSLTFSHSWVGDQTFAGAEASNTYSEGTESISCNTSSDRSFLFWWKQMFSFIQFLENKKTKLMPP